MARKVSRLEAEVVSLKEKLDGKNAEIGDLRSRMEGVEKKVAQQQAALKKQIKMTGEDAEIRELRSLVEDIFEKMSQQNVASDEPINMTEITSDQRLASSSSGHYEASLAKSFPKQVLRVAGDHMMASFSAEYVMPLEWTGDRDLGSSAKLELSKLSFPLKCVMEHLDALLNSINAPLSTWPVYLYTCTGCNVGHVEQLLDNVPSHFFGFQASTAINQRLREDGCQSLRAYLLALHGYLGSDGRARLQSSQDLWRGISVKGLSFQELTQCLPLGQTISFPGLTSTSRERDIAERYLEKVVLDAASTFKVLLRIQLHAPRHCPWRVDAYSVKHLTIFPQEDEVLVMPFVPMKVIALKKTSTSTVLVTLEVVGQSPLF